MPSFAHFLGLAFTFAAIVAFLIEPPRKSTKQDGYIKLAIQSKQAASGAEYEAIFLFSLLGLLASCVLLPRLIGASIPLPLIG